MLEHDNIAKSPTETPGEAKQSVTLALEPLVVTTEELAQLLRISVATLDRWRDSGRLGPPGNKIGGRRLWALTEIREWIARGMPPRETWLALVRANSVKSRR
jgi:predicted DNA-binding transcriptional regulator AlpA